MSRSAILFVLLAIGTASLFILMKPAQRVTPAEAPAENEAMVQLKAEFARLEADRLALTQKLHHTSKERDGALAILDQTAKQLDGLRNQLRQIATELAEARDREQTAASELANARTQMERMSAQMNALVAKSEEAPLILPVTITAPTLPTAQQFPALLFRHNRFAEKLERVLTNLKACETGSSSHRESAKTNIRSLIYQIQSSNDLPRGDAQLAMDFLANILRQLAAY